MAKILISAGEASGDVHAAAVTKALKKIDPSCEVFGMGGDCLREAGGEVLFDIKEHGVMGFIEVVKKLPALFKLRSDFGRVMDERRPDCLVTVDYPGFNMKLAKLAKDKGIPVVSYIPPSAWAWNKGRAPKVAKLVTKIASIFPFEYDVYKQALDFAGKQSGRRLILLLPGSRLMEIQKMLPTLLDAAKLISEKEPDIDFAMPRASTIPKEMLEGMIEKSGLKVKIVEGHIYDVMNVADLALATSGTVTLEAALCGLGCVIVYKTSPISAFIARRVINIPDIGLPNIVAGRHILPELLQEDFTPEKTAQEALQLLEPERNAQMKQDLEYVRERLGAPGAVNRVAELVLRVAKEKK